MTGKPGIEDTTDMPVSVRQSVDTQMLASIAISLKRIADAMEGVCSVALDANPRRLFDLMEAIEMDLRPRR